MESNAPKQFQNYPDVLNVAHVIEILDVSSKTVYRILNTGELYSKKVGREFRIPKVKLKEYLGIYDSQTCEYTTA